MCNVINTHRLHVCVYGIINTHSLCNGVWYNKHAHRLCVLEADPHSTQATCMVEAVTHRQCVYGIINMHTGYVCMV